MPSSSEWSDVQLRLLINERKQRNAEYHATPNKKKRDFWDDVANKLNEQENTNYFLGKDCHKMFLNLTKSFNTAKRYREGTGTKKSLVGEEIYEEFSTLFWLKPELPFERERNKSVRRNRTGSTSEPSTITTLEATAGERSSSSSKIVKNSKVTPSSTSVTPSTDESISRPVTPTLPSFSQSANVINVTINNNYAGAPEEED